MMRQCKKYISILLTLLLLAGGLPLTALADDSAPDPFGANPFLPSVGSITACAADGYTFEDWLAGSVSVALYTVDVPFGTAEVELRFRESETRVAYAYDAGGAYLASCGSAADGSYADNGQTGETTARVRADASGALPAFVRVQTPYDAAWSSQTLYAVTFRCFSAETAEAAPLRAEKTGLTYTCAYPAARVPVYSVELPAAADEVVLRFPQRVLTYNYDGNSVWLDGSYENDVLLAGVTEQTVRTDANADGVYDYILVQSPFDNATDWNSTPYYAITFGGSGAGGSGTPGDLAALLENIAASYTETADLWAVMDMAAYRTLHSDGAAVSAAALQRAVNTILADTSGLPGDRAKYEIVLRAMGKDSRQLYPVNSNTPVDNAALLRAAELGAVEPYTVPYLLLADLQGNLQLSAAQRGALLGKLAAAQGADGLFCYEWDGSVYPDVDTTAAVLAALAPVYATDAAAAAIADRALAALGTAQGTNGSYGNANTDAMVILGLAALGIDPDGDARFAKNGCSVLDGLLSYAAAGNSGFGNERATEQGFRALIAAAQLRQTGRAYNIYDFSANEVSAARATGAGESVTPPESTGDDITVTVSIRAGNAYWMAAKSVTIPGTGATAYHAFARAIAGTGITQVGAESGYIRSVSNGTETLAEFDRGENSGWLYLLNGASPMVGFTACAIADGDSVEVYYTMDYTQEPWSGETESKPAKPTAEQLFPDAPKEAYYWEALVWAAESGLFGDGADSALRLGAVCSRAQALTLLWRAAGCPEPQAGESPFRDLDADADDYKALLWAAQSGIAAGMTETAFAPAAPLNRAQAVTFLCRYAKAQAQQTGDWSFSDVAADSFYYDAVRWAAGRGITAGTGADTFSPAEGCLSEHILTFLWRLFARQTA